MDTLPDEARRLIAGANYVHLATLMLDGAPHSAAVWADIVHGRILIFAQTGSRKARNLARDARVALSVADRHDPYRTAQVRGRMVERIEGEPALAVADRLAVKYTGRAFPMRSPSTGGLRDPPRAGAPRGAALHAPADGLTRARRPLRPRGRRPGSAP